MCSSQPPDSGRFAQTDWSLVGRAGRGGPDGRRQALELLLPRYLPALRAHLVHRRGLSADASDDLLQEFVASKILERDLIAHARRNAGKFRTFLLTALDRFALNRLRDQRAKKRSPDHGRVVAMGEHVGHLADQGQPAEAFHAAWAHGVISEALGRMRVQCERSGRPDLWAVFHCRVVGPILEGTEPADYGELARRFRFRSPSQASNALVTAKRMYARTLRAVLAEYARDDAEIEAEIDDLRQILSRCGPS
jgi:RNA polymerase sigma-70 factor (ECF subfamily)